MALGLWGGGAACHGVGADVELETASAAAAVFTTATCPPSGNTVFRPTELPVKRLKEKSPM